MKTNFKKLAIILPLIFGTLLAPLMSLSAKADSAYDYSVDLTNRTYTADALAISIPTYSDLATFLTDRTAGTLAPIYITNFLFDGVKEYVPYDLDDLVAGTKTIDDFSPLQADVLNINAAGNILLSGEFSGTLALDTNNLAADVNLILANVTVTSGAKIPAVYIYNKDITYTEHQVTIKTLADTDNSIQGGKFKKVSLMDKDALASYASYYSGTAATNYAAYPEYYGIYSASEIENILFAKVQASQEDLSDGDPYYFYKGAGAISSDIDLTFEGEGTLRVASSKKEGIEGKGNLVFAGGKGDYYIYAQDDALNTTTARTVSGAHNSLTIDVNSLYAVVALDADEGDAIDSNGSLIINGGTIVALEHPTSVDDCLDSETGAVINGGTVYSTGNMADQISQSSAQASLRANITGSADTLLVVTDTNDNPLAAYLPGRAFKIFTYSSSALTSGQTYKVYTGGTVTGEPTSDATSGMTIYHNIIGYTGGTLTATVTASNASGGNQPSPGPSPDGGDDRPTPPSPDDRPTPPSPDDGGDDQGGNPPSSDDSDGNASPSDNSKDSDVIIDDEDVPIPDTAAGGASSDLSSNSSLPSSPNTGHRSATVSSVQAASPLAWSISGLSATTLVVYVLVSRKRHAIRFRC